MIRFHLKLPFLVVGDFGIDAIITKREKEREREKKKITVKGRVILRAYAIRLYEFSFFLSFLLFNFDEASVCNLRP